ncbi:MAG: DUF1989 domain-containing protein [Rhodobacter sp.]|nr:DUF1989 domain-containing protein [Rhodobacter sp.]MCY4166716.1 DUF1989 domain-containing protein [Rhodobacter sp.]MCY4240676.1 DUF1989 domain-containing protein [Rhodobacter sp.]
MPLAGVALHREFSNIGFGGRFRAFPGFPVRSEVSRRTLAPRDAMCLELEANDVVSVCPPDDRQFLDLLVFDMRGRPSPQFLGLETDSKVASGRFNSAALFGWLERQGGDVPDSLLSVSVELKSPVSLKARAGCTVWILRCVDAERLVSEASIGLVEVSHKKASSGSGIPLPPPLGDIRDEFTVSRCTARAYELRAGEFVQIIDVEGQQCSDFMALRGSALDDGVEMGIDGTATRTMVGFAYPGPGLLDRFFDRELRPMMRLVQDTCGQHDTFGMACTARGYEERGFPGHLNCSENISAALDPFGVAYRPAWPAVNFFWSTWIDGGSHRFMTEESRSRPGDYVALQALDDLVCVSTACPDDIDPINGWNPTDVHVRIYRPNAPIRRAIAYREREDAAMSLTRESAFHPATSKLTGQFAPVRDLWMPVTFPSVGTIGEYWACREKVTLQDMSSLRKYDVIGPDAERLLQRVLTRDIARLSIWRGTYALACDESGSVIDDGTLFRLGHELFRWCCGSEESSRVLGRIADTEGYQVRIHGMGSALPNLALQGPRSRDVLRKISFTRPTVPSLDDLKWFGFTMARVGNSDGIPYMLARSGYTGELGYELFCSVSDAPKLWDALMVAGREFGIAPMGRSALDILRVEAGFAASGAEFAPGVDAHEAGLGFAVNLEKSDFIGKQALLRNARDPRRVLRGLMFECAEVPASGSSVYSGERPIGVVTSATASPMLERAIAMARVAVEFADAGRKLEVGQLDGRMKRLPVTVCDLPFFDPERERARA